MTFDRPFDHGQAPAQFRLTCRLHTTYYYLRMPATRGTLPGPLSPRLFASSFEVEIFKPQEQGNTPTPTATPPLLVSVLPPQTRWLFAASSNKEYNNYYLHLRFALSQSSDPRAHHPSSSTSALLLCYSSIHHTLHSYASLSSTPAPSLPFFPSIFAK